MPATPLHLGVSLPLFGVFRRRLEFAPLVIGSMVPDIEIILMLPITGWDYRYRGVMHSFFGALTIDMAVALFLTYAFYPYFAKWLRSMSECRKRSFHIFAGRDITALPSSLWSAGFSASLGALSHVIWDAWNHPYNPLFWPLKLNFAPGGNMLFAVLLAHLVSGMLLIWALEVYWQV
ncbi:MAG: DUF4184 family protein [Candidatus Thermoplasmatota archaeon]